VETNQHTSIARPDLHAFCGHASRDLHLPFQDDHAAYACNGHIAIRHDSLGPTQYRSYADVPVYERISALLLDEDYPQTRPVPVLPKSKPCPSCMGTGRATTCDDCEGNGEFRHGNHDYTCKTCDGRGQYTSVFAEPDTQCNACSGSGRKHEHQIPIQVGSQAVGLAYLRLIAPLPGVQLHLKKSAGPTGTAPIRFTYAGGCGVILPMRV